MRRTLVAANWKMHGNRKSNAALVMVIKQAQPSFSHVDLVIAAPFVYLEQVQALLADTPIALAAQNVSEFEAGAYTGEVSATMLADIACRFAIIGHSERRQDFHESDEQIVEKFARLQQQHITPILCVGETLEQRQAGHTDAVVSKQLLAIVNKLGVTVLKNAVIAYEPVWAIGSGNTASPAQAQAVHHMLRTLVASHDKNIADGLRILYGGSVNESNAAELFGQADIDGGLVGGASLDAENFIKLCKVVRNG